MGHGLIRLLTFLLLAGAAQAQQFTGTINGTVRDAAGAVIPGAEVSITNASTNEIRTLITRDDGTYTAPLLKPGNYRVAARLLGFKTATIEAVKLDVQQVRTVDLTLELG